MSTTSADSADAKPATVTDVACTACSCICDDLRLTVAGGKVTGIEPPCPLAEKWFATVQAAEPPAAAIDGQPANLGDALDRAAAILAAANNPLILGLARSSTPGARAAVRLAEKLGATIDVAASSGQAAATIALQEVGQSTCTLGEVRHRADLVIYIGSNPAASHPRHLQRYSLWPQGEFIAGRDARTLAVIDVQPTETSQQADLFLQVQPGGDFDLLAALRALVRGVPPAESPVAAAANPGGVPLTAVEDLANRMKSCRSGVVFFGPGLTAHGLGHRTVEALFRLVAELNDHTRFYAMRMRGQNDLGTAGSVLCWQTGYPLAVNFGRGYPRYNPGEYCAEALLRRREVDACLLIGSDAVAALSAEAQAQLARLPLVVLDEPYATSAGTPKVRFTTAIYGLHAAGTAYRMDEVPIPLKAVVDTDYPTDDEVLTALHNRLSG